MTVGTLVKWLKKEGDRGEDRATSSPRVETVRRRWSSRAFLTGRCWPCSSRRVPRSRWAPPSARSARRARRWRPRQRPRPRLRRRAARGGVRPAAAPAAKATLHRRQPPAPAAAPRAPCPGSAPLPQRPRGERNQDLAPRPQARGREGHRSRGHRGKRPGRAHCPRGRARGPGSRRG